MPLPSDELEEREQYYREIPVLMYHMTIQDIRQIMAIARMYKTQRLDEL